ncbi:MAG: caspase family protein [Akkermansia sp.]|nr:caspase family protein [Akkermansia sp.]
MKRNNVPICALLLCLSAISATGTMVDNPLTGERINVPDRDWNRISTVVSELEGQLSRWDYGMLLQGLDDWFKLREYYLARNESRDSEAESYDRGESCSPVRLDQLIDTLRKISRHPEDRKLFLRPILEEPPSTGVVFQEDIRNNGDWVYHGDSNYLITLRKEADYVRYSFWNSRTCRLDSSLLIPMDANGLKSEEGEPPSYPFLSSTHADAYAMLCSDTYLSWAHRFDRLTWEEEGKFPISPYAIVYAPSSRRLYPVSSECSQEQYMGKGGVHDRYLDGRAQCIATCLATSKKMGEESAAPMIDKRVLRPNRAFVIEEAADNEGLYFWPAKELSFWLDPDSAGSGDVLRLTLSDGVKENVDLNRLANTREYGKCRIENPYAIRQASPDLGALKALLKDIPMGNKYPAWRKKDHVDVAIEAQDEGIAIFSIPFPYDSGVEATEEWNYLMGITINGAAYLFPAMDAFTGGKRASLIEYSCLKVELLFEKREVETLFRYAPFDEDMASDRDIFAAICGATTMGHPLLMVGNKYKIHFFDLDSAAKSATHLREMDCYGELPALWWRKNQLLLLPVNEHQYKMLDVSDPLKDNKVADLYLAGRDGYAIVLPNGHYACTPACESYLLAGDGQRRLGIAPLAPWYNRPHEVLETLNGNADDIAALRETTRRWLKKTHGMDLDNMPEQPAISDFPETVLEIPAPLVTDGAQAAATIKFTAHARPITKFHMRVDGAETEVPAMDTLEAGNSRSIEINIPLSVGQNWVEITPEDSAGYSGDSLRFRIVRRGDDDSALYVVAMGVSKYQDSSLNLQYAAKDAADLCAALKKHGKGTVKTLLLTDEKVCPAALDEIRAFLKDCRIQDRVVLYVAGHGLLDDELTYHYAPYGIDTEDVKGTGIDIDSLLEKSLGDCAARKRVLLLDTCHSGSLGEEDLDKLAANGMNLPHGVRAIASRGMKVKSADAVLNSAQKKRYIEEMFSMAGTRRGVNILAGSSGSEFALESTEWSNGVFTACLLQAINGDVGADFDFDGILNLNELQQYVSARVHQMTAGMQKISVDAAEDGSAFPLAVGKLSLPRGEKPISLKMEWNGTFFSPLPGKKDMSDDTLKAKGYSTAQIKALHAILPQRKKTELLIDVCRSDFTNEAQKAAAMRQKAGALSDAGKDEEALILIIRAARDGDATAQRWLGWRYYQGRGVPKDLECAWHWFEQAANKGDAAAREALKTVDPYAGWSAERIRKEGGRLSDAGQQELALILIRRAAQMGDSTAQRWMGYRYLNGRGVSEDLIEARYWFSRAADQGDRKAADALKDIR